ncbi:uncharacterized protein BKA78DRAFT_312358 [Phyllosticta capitalensis]|uniref:uncharacterized protein n=1 Tax=Phyllosticta capitalensis TaxID=121624 RepID=UPI00312E203C
MQRDAMANANHRRVQYAPSQQKSSILCKQSEALPSSSPGRCPARQTRPAKPAATYTQGKKSWHRRSHRPLFDGQPPFSSQAVTCCLCFGGGGNMYVS